MFDAPGSMRCGPAPLAAIKEGQVYIPHDTGFVFAEVNGEKIHWLVTYPFHSTYKRVHIGCKSLLDVYLYKKNALITLGNNAANSHQSRQGWKPTEITH